ncbi:hypothetical protein ACFY04_19450 [Streptomyces sp. NPDC001549]|uniref:hypothetical protein n=1 Tax=Streptomyces sp. NPDC001549 TaxID=3364586 RepID=UPI0036B780AF
MPGQTSVGEALMDVPLQEPADAESLFADARAPAVVGPEFQEKPPVAHLTFVFVDRTLNFT